MDDDTSKSTSLTIDLTPSPLDDILANLGHQFIKAKVRNDIAAQSAIAAAFKEIERLRAVVTRQALELLVAHSEALGLYGDE